MSNTSHLGMVPRLDFSGPSTALTSTSMLPIAHTPKRGHLIFPVPPLQLLGVALAGARVVDRAAEDVEEAAVLGLAAQRADGLVHGLRVLPAQVRHAPE